MSQARGMDAMTIPRRMKKKVGELYRAEATANKEKFVDLGKWTRPTKTGGAGDL